MGEVGDDARCALGWGAAASVRESFLGVLDRIDALASGTEVLLPSAPGACRESARSRGGCRRNSRALPFPPPCHAGAHVDHVRSVKSFIAD